MSQCIAFKMPRQALCEGRCIWLGRISLPYPEPLQQQHGIRLDKSMVTNRGGHNDALQGNFCVGRVRLL